MRTPTVEHADDTTCSQGKISSLVLPKATHLSTIDSERLDPQTYYAQDKAGSLPSAPPGAPSELKKEAEPMHPPPMPPQGARPELAPDVKSRANTILLNYKISWNEINAKYAQQIQEVCAEAVLGPGVMAKFEATYKASEVAVDAALAKATQPEFKALDELCEDMRAVLKANKGAPESNPEVTKMFQDRIDKIMAGVKKDPKDGNPYALPANGFSGKYVDAFQRILKTELCLNKWRSFDTSKFSTLVPGGTFSALYDGVFGKALHDEIETMYPGFHALRKVVETDTELLKAENALKLKRDLVFAKQKELGRAWVTPTDPRFLPKCKELSDEYKKELKVILVKRDQELKEIGLMLEPKK